MRKLLISIFVSLCAMGASADDNEATRTINGAVIDVTGNPLPGAIIETQEGVTATADADGTFSMQVSGKTKWLRASYPGVGIKLAKLKDRDQSTGYSLIEVKKAKSHYWFCTIQAGVSFAHGSVYGSDYDFTGDFTGGDVAIIGASFGYLNNWGGYISATANDSDGGTGTIGITKRLWTSWTYRSNLYVYGGFGYDGMEYTSEQDDGYVTTVGGVIAEAGVIYRHRRFVATAGYGHTFGTDYSETSADRIICSIGFCF